MAAVNSGLAPDIYTAAMNKIVDYTWKIDFGKLLQFVGGPKKEIKRAVLFGSKPPQNDSLWSSAQKKGFEVITHDRSINNKEKKIDTDIVSTVMEDSYEKVVKLEDEIVLVAGDKDYVPAIEKIRKRGIKVILCFWGHASKELIEACDDFYNMDSFLEHLKKSS